MEENENRRRTYHNQARWSKEAAMIETIMPRLRCCAHQYRWSSTCCSGWQIARPVQPVAASRTCSRTDYPPVAADHPTPFVKVVAATSNRLLWQMGIAHDISRIKKKCRYTCWFSDIAVPNKSTIGWLALLVGELRKGFVLVLDGDCTFACNTYIENLNIVHLKLKTSFFHLELNTLIANNL